MRLAPQPAHERALRPTRSSVLGAALATSLRPQRIETDCLTTVLNPAHYRFNGRTAQPLGLIQPQDAMSRHRGAEPGRRCELLDQTAVIRRGSFIPVSHGPSTRYRGSLSPTFVSAPTVCLAVKLPCAFTLCGWLPNHPEGTFGRLRTFSGATAPANYLPATVPAPAPGPRLWPRPAQAGYHKAMLHRDWRPSFSPPQLSCTDQALVAIARCM